MLESEFCAMGYYIIAELSLRHYCLKPWLRANWKCIAKTYSVYFISTYQYQ